MRTVPLVGHRVGSWFNLTRTMIIPFYGTCKSTINWVIEIPLRVNPIRRENQHLSEKRFRFCGSPWTCPPYNETWIHWERKRDVKFTIKFHEILADEIEKIFLLLFFFFSLKMLKYWEKVWECLNLFIYLFFFLVYHNWTRRYIL